MELRFVADSKKYNGRWCVTDRFTGKRVESFLSRDASRVCAKEMNTKPAQAAQKPAPKVVSKATKVVSKPRKKPASKQNDTKAVQSMCNQLVKDLTKIVRTSIDTTSHQLKELLEAV